MRRVAFRTFLAVAAIAGLVLGVPATAEATTSGTDRSEILEALPPSELFELEVLDADDQVRITVADGHRVEVPGYQGEPWLVFHADGTLEENVASPAGWMNRSADGRYPVPADASSDAEPRWVSLGSTRTHRWHDHRVHDMGEGSGLSSGQIKGWTVVLVVDGTPTDVHGRLERLPLEPWWPWAILVLVTAGAGVAWCLPDPVRRSSAVAGVAAVAVTTSAVGGYVGAEVPGAADLVHLGLALGGAGVLAASMAVREPPTRRGLVVLGATALLAASAVGQIAALADPVIISALPDVMTRVAVALAAGAAVAVAGALTWTGLGATART